ncbi:EF hand domain containing protein [Acanthamoeba castellanii str. Neff]|uniref:EF hand domain containing protein n=1 Tax=Acanthamoeba castellanii (strain ATCC 30010 / Neff) TaxID=1257118 RepID=L8H515_ACACF|nr:EF hand domain containing protein [Acanthamoeba castellanii str. Neff]ELR19828.1 EF hand domain containing protein [Acanthamoeba castellanii str. Neff]
MEAVVPSEASAADTLLDKLQWRWVLLGGAVAFFGAAVARKKLRQRQKKQRTNQTVHRGIICGDCGDIIRGIRYMCANCADFDLCETCEAKESHYKTHVFLKIRIPIPALAIPPGALLPVLYPGGAIGEISHAEVKELKRKTHFDEVELEALFEQFKALATSKNGIDKDTFERCLGPLGVETNLITDRIFKFFDQDGNGTIDFSELVCGLSVLCKGTPEEKIKYAFKGYDLDGDGYIDKEELYKMFKAYFYLSMEAVREAVKVIEEELILNYNDNNTNPVSSAFVGLPDAETQEDSITKQPEDAPLNNEDLSPIMDSMYQVAIEEMVEKAFSAADVNNDGKITYEEFRAWALQDPTMISWLEALGSVF